MFDHDTQVVGLLPGEGPEDAMGEVDLAFDLTCRELADGWTAQDRHLLPDDLEALPAGPFLAAVAAGVEPGKLNGHDVVRLMQARARLASHHEAAKYEAMAEIAYAPPSDPSSGVIRSSEEVEYAAVEVAAALRLTRRSSEEQLTRAVVLSERLPRVRESFLAGILDLPRVRILERSLGHLPSETVERVLDSIGDEVSDLTTGQLRARLSHLVLEADPDGAASSFEEGLLERNVVVSPNPDHTANLNIYSSHPEDVARARANVESLARSLKSAGEPRTLDQLRADVALGLLAGGGFDRAASGGGRVNVTIPAATLVGLSDSPGELDGYGPVIAEIARKTVAENIDGEWVFTVTDQGRPIATGTVSRRPTAGQQRHLRALYPTCVFPGCRRPAHQCDLDHWRPVSQGGPTHNDNLTPLCRHHHMLRHHKPWQYRRRPNGDHVWTSPLGHTYTRKRSPPD